MKTWSRHIGRVVCPQIDHLSGAQLKTRMCTSRRETVNPFYDRCPEEVQRTMDKFAQIVGRQYHLFDYAGAPDADRVIVVMGSGAETAEETAKYLNDHGEKTGVLKVHLFRPFSIKHFVESLPKSVKSLAVLDRTKEPGSTGEPLYQDIVTALAEMPKKISIQVIGGRYGLSSKEFTPAMVKAVFDELQKE